MDEFRNVSLRYEYGYMNNRNWALPMVSFITTTGGDRLDVACLHIPTLQSCSEDCGDNGLANICVSSVDLNALQFGPQCSTNALHIFV